MGLLTCDDGTQPEWCPSTSADVLPSVLALLPNGPAWDGQRQSGTVANKFWTAIADVTSWIYDLLCRYEQEFFCDTVDLSRDQWIKAWALDQNCDPFGYNLCAKVTAIGGASCPFFVSIAYRAGYVITCRNLADDPQPIAGCFQCGCTPLGITPTLKPKYKNPCPCVFGQVIDHPQPQFWDTTKTDQADCPVPGSNLGIASGAPDCCFVCGYYEEQLVVNPYQTQACVDGNYTIRFPAVNLQPCFVPSTGPTDSTGNFIDYGDAFVWEVTVDIPASRILQGLAPASSEPISNAGNFVVGCTPLCVAQTEDFLQCLLGSIKPAHTVLIYRTIQP